MGDTRVIGTVSIVRPKRELSSGQSIRRTHYELVTADDEKGYWLRNSQGRQAGYWDKREGVLRDVPASWTVGEWGLINDEVHWMVVHDLQPAQGAASDSSGA